MADHRSIALRLALPFGLALLALLGLRSWAQHRESRREDRQKLVDSCDRSFRVPERTFLEFPPSRTNSPSPWDPVAVASEASGWPLRHRGGDSGWTWGCLQTPDSGIVLFFAFDSGCTTNQGQFWSDSRTVFWKALDLERGLGGPERQSTATRTLWTFPGSQRTCLPTHAHQAPDSIQALCEGRSPSR